MHGGNSGSRSALSDDSPIPLKWVFLSLGLSISAIVGSIGAALAVGSWTSQISLGQQAQSARISTLETQREQSLEFRRILFEKLAVLETKVDAIRNDGRRK